MNYKLVQTSVVETKTEQVIKTFNDRNEAKKFMRHLNLGGGFDSWTPSFILKNIFKNTKKVTSNI